MQEGRMRFGRCTEGMRGTEEKWAEYYANVANGG